MKCGGNLIFDDCINRDLIRWGHRLCQVCFEALSKNQLFDCIWIAYGKVAINCGEPDADTV
ncbi:hypothetical protein GC163_01210 [bacterium]|nr:hypothetical protein [bacterium]